MKKKTDFIIEKRTFFKETGTHDYWYPEFEVEQKQQKIDELEEELQKALILIGKMHINSKIKE